MNANDPSLSLLWETFTGYQRTAAIRAAIELDLFSKIGAGVTTIEALATQSQAARQCDCEHQQHGWDEQS
jgi:hypothetical protein